MENSQQVKTGIPALIAGFMKTNELSFRKLSDLICEASGGKVDYTHATLAMWAGGDTVPDQFRLELSISKLPEGSVKDLFVAIFNELAAEPTVD